MPNHITNGVTISHEDKAKLAELRKNAIKEVDGTETFDFNALIPMPEELMITSGSNTDLGMACFDQEYFDRLAGYGWFKERYNNAKTPAELKATLEKSEVESDRKAIQEGEQAVKNLKKYGYKDWYDWSNANWGTKWNAYSFQLVKEDENGLHIQFDTAWATPYPIWDKLKDLGFSVDGWWLDEGGGEGLIGDGGDWSLERRVEFYG